MFIMPKEAVTLLTELLGKQSTNCEKSADDNRWVCTAVFLLHGNAIVTTVCNIASPTHTGHKAILQGQKFEQEHMCWQILNIILYFYTSLDQNYSRNMKLCFMTDYHS